MSDLTPIDNHAMKTCLKCAVEKSLNDFYADRRASDGRCGRCKKCHCRHISLSHDNDDFRERARAKFRDNPRLQVPSQKWAANNPVKRKAQKTAQYAVRTGRLVREPCCVCGTTDRINAHHEDYSRPLDVIWFCAKHHSQHHADLNRETA